ncbi:MAG: amino acid transporter LysE [Akkermansiaceae bacterium]|nr:amino acid transporter LysE [Akkermansiaceae bacterium]
MFPPEVLLAYVGACLIIIISPGPDNILSISRGLSQGHQAACVSSVGAGLGIVVHTLAAVFGLGLLIQTSQSAFWIVKIAGACYLIWLGIRALRSGELISFAPAARKSLGAIFRTGFLSNVLNPKPSLFVLAFIPQFVSAQRGSIQMQMLVYGVIFAVMTAALFSTMGCFASQLTGFLRRRPKTSTALNTGAGLTFIASGLSILAIRQRP